ncbi:hypothetical protein R9X47_19295 [Wukongibacter baidiensis]|uniref:hypothetical protein n=1 Tax=Wukongibacter baidiensis TaxID=1723361 RepID=UPI003D7F6E49
MTEQLNFETINELYGYIQKLIPALIKLSNKLRNIKDEDTLELMRVVVEGIEWSFNIILLNKEHFSEIGIVLDYEKIREVTEELSEALTNKDLLLTADILEYEMVDIFTIVNDKLENYLKK